jgi:hypothetical protein
MSISEKDMQQAFASLALPVDRRPTPEEIAALVDGEGDERQRLDTLERLMATPDGVAELAMVRALREGIVAAQKEQPNVIPFPRAATRMQPWLRALALSAAVLAIALVGTTQLFDSDADDVLRSGNTTVTLIAPGNGARSSGGITFSWFRIQDATYDVELYSAAGKVIVRRQTADSTLSLPAGAVSRGDYRWWVTARLDNGTQVRSETRRIDVR